MSWTKDWKNLGGTWDSKAAAQEVADGLQDRIGQFEYCGTLKAVVVTQHSPKPVSDPGFVVWSVRGTFETSEGAETELWLTRDPG